MHVEPARRAAVEEGTRDAASRADVAAAGDVRAGLEEHERVRRVGRGVVRLRVRGAGVVDGEVAAGAAAVGGAGKGQVLQAHVATERPGVVPPYKLVPLVGEVGNGVLLLGHLCVFWLVLVLCVPS